jgi:hypothetical protein
VEGDPVRLTDVFDLTKVFVDPTAYADEERFHAACRSPSRRGLEPAASFGDTRWT